MTAGIPISRANPPRAIKLFAVSYVAFAIIAFVNNLQFLGNLLDLLTEQLGQQAPQALGIISFGMRLLLRLSLAWFIYNRASNVARWFVMLLALQWVYQSWSAILGVVKGESGWTLWYIAFFFQVFAIICLWLRAARGWIANEGRIAPTDESIWN